jgi:Fic family protein
MSSGKDDLKSLNEKLEIMMRRLDYLEAILTENRQYPELAQIMGGLRVGTSLYAEPLKLIERLIGVRRYLDKTPESRDEVSRLILNALAIKGAMNISELTRHLAQERGAASRVTVRKRIKELLVEGIIEKGNGHQYQLVK